MADNLESDKQEIIKQVLKATTEALTKLNITQKEIATGRATLETEINELFAAQKTELVSKLESHTNQQLDKLLAQKKRVEYFQVEWTKYLESAEKGIPKGCPEGLQVLAKDLIKQLDQDTLKSNEQTSFIPSAQLTEDCQTIGHLLYSDVPQTAKVGIRATAHFRIDPPRKGAPFKAELVSKSTDKATECTVKGDDNGEYKILFEPKTDGVHQLCVRVGGEDVKGSPFGVKVEIAEKIIEDIYGPWGVTTSQSGNVIVAEMKSCYIQIYDCKAKNEPKLFETEIGTVYGVAVDGDDNILAVSFGNRQLVKYSQEGTMLATVGSESGGQGHLKGPIGVCAHSNGKVYVVDNLAHCVHILNPDFTFLSKFGSQGSGNGQFNYPRDIAVDSAGYVYVVDEVNHRVQVFTPEGIYQRKFGTKGSGNGELDLPVSICIDSEDTVYVGEDMNARISVFTSKGDFVRSIGSKGTGPGQFDRPFGLAVRSGLLYVCDYGNNRVQVIPVNE